MNSKFEEQFSRIMSGQDGCFEACTNGVTSDIEPPTVDQLMAIIDEMCTPEPFALFMKEQGKSPTDGWVLFIPTMVRRRFGELPKYVKYSPLVKYDHILFVKTELGDPLSADCQTINWPPCRVKL
jgi:hypothetical protein